MDEIDWPSVPYDSLLLLVAYGRDKTIRDMANVELDMREDEDNEWDWYDAAIRRRYEGQQIDQYATHTLPGGQVVTIPVGPQSE